MDNLNISHIAAAVVIVEFFNLLIVLLTKTETILKIVERIKKVVGLDYKTRAKRSEDELRLFKKHSQVAKERVRHSFVIMPLWGCIWAWNWSDDFEPVNIKGYCSTCKHPVIPYYYFPENEPEPPPVRMLGLTCSQRDKTADPYTHHKIRTRFEILFRISQENSAEEVFYPMIKEAIITERDTKIANEVDKLRQRFWR